MKFSTAALLVLATAASTTQAFAPATSVTSKTASSNTARYFLDTTKGGGGDSIAEDGLAKNPIKDIQSYIPSPEPVEVRQNLASSTCIVSGSKAVSPDLFYLLNHEDSAFAFKKIVAISSDVASTKKQLLTRQARYAGLLSKLDYESSSLLPTSSLLEEASSWIAVIDNLSDLALITQSAAKVENVSILFMASPDDSASTLEQAFDALKAANPNSSLVIVDQIACDTSIEQEEFALKNTKQRFAPLLYFDEEVTSTALNEMQDPAFLAEEALRMVTECLQLQAAAGKSISLRLIENDTVTATSAKQSPQQLFPKLVKGLRNAGYDRPQEIDYMLRFGVSHYATAIQEFETENPTAKNGVVHTNAWWEDEKFQKMVKKSSLRQEELVEANRMLEERLLQEEQEKKFA